MEVWRCAGLWVPSGVAKLRCQEGAYDPEQDGPVERCTRIDVDAPVEQVWKVLREVER